MQFKDVIGQQSVKSQLVKMVQQNRLSHALLFLGKEGSGALPLALAFAQYIVCTSAKTSKSIEPSLFSETSSSPSPPRGEGRGEDSCGFCPACIKANQLIHPDIHFSFPVITKKPGESPVSANYIREWREFVDGNPYGNVYDWLQFITAENKQGNITAKECEEINHILNLKSFESGYKILIMWMPEFLGKEGNKLLKLIEEPPPDTLFIFVAEDENVILPTILSRTQLVKILALTDEEIEKALITQGKVENNKAKQIAGVSEGNYREALQMFQHAEENWQGMVREWLNTIVKTGPIAQVKWIDEISKLGREKQKQFLQYFIHLLQQALRIRIQATSFNPNLHLTNNIPEKDQDFAARLNKMCSLEAQEAIINELNKAAYYIERNAHAKMLFHALTIRLYHIIKDNSLILIN
jgi:DNA polymerase-3 subunit delta'